MSSDTMPGDDPTCKIYLDQQQDTMSMLDRQPIEIVAGNHHEIATQNHNNFTIQPSLSSSVSFNQFGSSGSSGSIKRHRDYDMTDEEKRQQVLEKNRLAASKCRQRKKAWVEELAKKSDQAMHQNASLKRVISQLKEDILFLKSQLLAHRGCQCQIINNYIKLHMLDSFQQYEIIQSTSSNPPLVASTRRQSFR